MTKEVKNATTIRNLRVAWFKNCLKENDGITVKKEFTLSYDKKKFQKERSGSNSPN